MMNWVHCNKCSALFQKNKDLEYYITECGHIFCRKCYDNKESSDTCFICKKKSGIIQLSNEMDPSVLSFFLPLEFQFKKCLEISNFQNGNRDSLLFSFQRKYEYVKEQFMKQTSIYNKIVQENKVLRAMLRNSTSRNKPTSSTPINHNNVSFQNVSASTISPDKTFSFGSTKKGVFTPVGAYPGLAQRLCTSKLSNKSTNSQGISPAQVVPNAARSKPFAPIHRSNLGTMSSMQDLLGRNKSFKL